MPLTYEQTKFGEQKRKRKGVFLACQKCQREFYVSPARVRQAANQGVTTRFCSMACYDKRGANGPFYGKSHTPEQIQAWMTNPNRHSFKSDENNPNVLRYGSDYKHKESRHLRDRLLEGRNSRCERCGFDSVPGVLEIHHADRNRRNNDFSNLTVLCPTCHAIDHFHSRDGLYNKLKNSA